MPDLPAAYIPDTEVRILRSSQVKQDYRISIALPYEYLDFQEKTYPTIYILDANLYFGMFTEISRMLYLCGMTESIIVGIGYPLDLPLEESFNEMMALRSLDLTPVVDEAYEAERAQLGMPEKTGGASKFLSFLADDVIPMVEAEYRTAATDRTLVGHSFGGLFALYTLFQKPTLFRNYIVGSPYLFFGDMVLFDYEERFAEDRTSLPVKLFLSAGGLEESITEPYVSNLYKFKARLLSRNYTDFELTSQIFEKCNHCAAIAPMFQFGMMEMLPGR
jgi:predicted alpha/beta superfamily hydrolase